MGQYIEMYSGRFLVFLFKIRHVTYVTETVFQIKSDTKNALPLINCYITMFKAVQK